MGPELAVPSGIARLKTTLNKTIITSRKIMKFDEMGLAPEIMNAINDALIPLKIEIPLVNAAITKSIGYSSVEFT